MLRYQRLAQELLPAKTTRRRRSLLFGSVLAVGSLGVGVWALAQNPHPTTGPANWYGGEPADATPLGNLPDQPFFDLNGPMASPIRGPMNGPDASAGTGPNSATAGIARAGVDFPVPQPDATRISQRKLDPRPLRVPVRSKTIEASSVARQMLDDARYFADQGDLSRARQLALQAKRFPIQWADSEQTPAEFLQQLDPSTVADGGSETIQLGSGRSRIIQPAPPQDAQVDVRRLPDARDTDAAPYSQGESENPNIESETGKQLEGDTSASADFRQQEFPRSKIVEFAPPVPFQMPNWGPRPDKSSGAGGDGETNATVPPSGPNATGVQSPTSESGGNVPAANSTNPGGAINPALPTHPPAAGPRPPANNELNLMPAHPAATHPVLITPLQNGSNSVTYQVVPAPHHSQTGRVPALQGTHSVTDPRSVEVTSFQAAPPMAAAQPQLLRIEANASPATAGGPSRFWYDQAPIFAFVLAILLCPITLAICFAMAVKQIARHKGPIFQVQFSGGPPQNANRSTRRRRRTVDELDDGELEDGGDYRESDRGMRTRPKRRGPTSRETTRHTAFVDPTSDDTPAHLLPPMPATPDMADQRQLAEQQRREQEQAILREIYDSNVELREQLQSSGEEFEDGRDTPTSD